VSSRAFTVSDARYFPGTVALVNSLAISGNSVPLTVLDRGLTVGQRRLIEPHCEIVPHAGDRSALLSKFVAPGASDADVVLLVDSDIIVTGLLTDAIQVARSGAVYAFPDAAYPDRWFGEWTQLLELRAPLRRDAYRNTGFVALPGPGRSGLLERWAEACDRLAACDAEAGPEALTPVDTDPLQFEDQDCINALLMSEVPVDHVVTGPPHGMVMQPDDLRVTQVVDVEQLRCTWRSEPVTMLHAIGPHKPWQPRGGREFRPTAFTRCLLRVLTGPDLVVRIPERELVPWLRSHRAASTVRGLLHAYDALACATRPARHRLVARARGFAPSGRDHSPARPEGDRVDG